MRNYRRAAWFVLKEAARPFNVADQWAFVIGIVVYLGLVGIARLGWLGTWAKENNWAVAFGLLALLFFWVAVKLKVKELDQAEQAQPRQRTHIRTRGGKTTLRGRTILKNHDVGIDADGTEIDIDEDTTFE